MHLKNEARPGRDELGRAFRPDVGVASGRVDRERKPRVACSAIFLRATCIVNNRDIVANPAIGSFGDEYLARAAL
jgi:hypothetical protein